MEDFAASTGISRRLAEEIYHDQFADMPLDIPNLLTWARILLIPLFVGVFYAADRLRPAEFDCDTAVFVVAAITDWFDGWLARKLNQTSAFGAFLDPVADKLMVAAALVYWYSWGAPMRLLRLSSLAARSPFQRCANGWQKLAHARALPSRFVGKLKTACPDDAIPMLLWHAAARVAEHAGNRLAASWGGLLTLWSMAYYLSKAWPEISSSAALTANPVDVAIIRPPFCGSSSVGRAQPCQG
jgi:cardiolipin synthase